MLIKSAHLLVRKTERAEERAAEHERRLFGPRLERGRARRGELAPVLLIVRSDEDRQLGLRRVLAAQRAHCARAVALGREGDDD